MKLQFIKTMAAATLGLIALAGCQQDDASETIAEKKAEVKVFTAYTENHAASRTMLEKKR